MRQRRLGPFAVSAIGLGCMNPCQTTVVGRRYNAATQAELHSEKS